MEPKGWWTAVELRERGAKGEQMGGTWGSVHTPGQTWLALALGLQWALALGSFGLAGFGTSSGSGFRAVMWKC